MWQFHGVCLSDSSLKNFALIRRIRIRHPRPRGSQEREHLLIPGLKGSPLGHTCGGSCLAVTCRLLGAVLQGKAQITPLQLVL